MPRPNLSNGSIGRPPSAPPMPPWGGGPKPAVHWPAPEDGPTNHRCGIRLDVIGNRFGDLTDGGVSAAVCHVTVVALFGTVNGHGVVPIPRKWATDLSDATAPPMLLHLREGLSHALVPAKWNAEQKTWTRLHPSTVSGGNSAQPTDERIAQLVHDVLGYASRTTLLDIHDRASFYDPDSDWM